MTAVIDGILIEGTPEEIVRLLKARAPQGVAFATGTGGCPHDYDFSSTLPACRKCGQVAVTQPNVTVT